MTKEPRCQWCGRAFEPVAGPGRPRAYCRTSCRQRDYKARRQATELGLGEHELVIARAELESLRDRIALVAYALKDLDEAETQNDAQQAQEALVEAARSCVAQPTNGL